MNEQDRIKALAESELPDINIFSRCLDYKGLYVAIKDENIGLVFIPLETYLMDRLEELGYWSRNFSKGGSKAKTILQIYNNPKLNTYTEKWFETPTHIEALIMAVSWAEKEVK